MAFDLGLENKVVVITGGATGIGFATGLEFARQGAHVAICGRSEAKLAKAREAFAAEGFELFTEALDVCDAEKLYAFGDHVIEKFGRLDVWMNNAGIAITKPLLEFTEEEWNRVLDLNLNAVFHGSQYAARKMIALGNGGVILNAGSFQALMPAAAAVPYGTTKAAVVMFSRRNGTLQHPRSQLHTRRYQHAHGHRLAQRDRPDPQHSLVPLRPARRSGKRARLRLLGSRQLHQRRPHRRDRRQVLRAEPPLRL